MKNPDCTKCVHYYITLDERRPKACKVFNIKGQIMPSIEVRRYTGHHCPVFQARLKESQKVIKRSSILDTFA